MKIQWLFKINFYLHIIPARISSLLIYAYRERSGSTVMDLRDLKIYYPSPVKAKLGSAHVTRDSVLSCCKMEE